jgi:hypothetical protein
MRKTRKIFVYWTLFMGNSTKEAKTVNISTIQATQQTQVMQKL